MRCFTFGFPLGGSCLRCRLMRGDAAITTRSRAITANAPLIRPLATFSQGRRLFVFFLHHRHQCLALALDSVRAAVGGQEVALALLDRDGLTAAGQFTRAVGDQQRDKALFIGNTVKIAVLGIDGEYSHRARCPPKSCLTGGVRSVTSSAFSTCRARGLPSAPTRP